MALLDPAVRSALRDLIATNIQSSTWSVIVKIEQHSKPGGLAEFPYNVSAEISIGQFKPKTGQ